MGLVTASIGLSKRLEVLTREAEGELLLGAFDLDEIAEHNKFVKHLWGGATGVVSGAFG